MDTFEPLVELRGEWRQAAAISVPAAAAQVAAALDRGLDVLVDNDQVDEDSLTMAAETVCKAVVARADEVELLRRRLHRAIRDYITVTAIDQAPISADSSAFESEEALAAALFASVGESIGAEEEEFEAVAPQPGRTKKIDEKALKKTLASQPGKGRRRVISTIKLAIPLAMVGGVLVYVLHNPLVQSVTQPQPSGPVQSDCPATAAAGQYAGCIAPAATNCVGGTKGTAPAGCTWPFEVVNPGRIEFTLRWATDDKLALALLTTDGSPVAPAVSGTGGKLTLILPNLHAGDYTLQVTSPAKTKGPVTFNVTSPNVSAG